jgi:hypothetical protein
MCMYGFRRVGSIHAVYLYGCMGKKRCMHTSIHTPYTHTRLTRSGTSEQDEKIQFLAFSRVGTARSFEILRDLFINNHKKHTLTTLVVVWTMFQNWSSTDLPVTTARHAHARSNVHIVTRNVRDARAASLGVCAARAGTQIQSFRTRSDIVTWISCNYSVGFSTLLTRRQLVFASRDDFFTLVSRTRVHAATLLCIVRVRIVSESTPTMFQMRLRWRLMCFGQLT